MSAPEIATSLARLHDRLHEVWASERTLGFVPTMGALHEGHLALVRASLEACDETVVSIFVNPTQFGPGEDLERYPRDLARDADRLAGAGEVLIWHPTAEEMYPRGFATRLEIDRLGDRLCGASRPGHFSGVLTVVLKLFNQVRPDRAFFGQKDYQQTRVIRRMVRDLDVPVDVVVCPTVREADGLALSSRNAYLTPEQRAAAPILHRTLQAMNAAFTAGERDPRGLLRQGRLLITEGGPFRLDYLELCDPDSLEPRTDRVQVGDLIAVAAYLGSTRLIDNHLLV